jgi:K+-sensing histidine kinase KdpD
MRTLAASQRDRLALIAALLVPLGACAALVPVRTTFPNTDAALVLVAVVVAVAANGHRLAGVLAALSAAAWFDFFLTQPYERFTNSAVTVEVISGVSAANAATTPSRPSESPTRSPTRSRRTTSTQLGSGRGP